MIHAYTARLRNVGLQKYKKISLTTVLVVRHDDF